MIVNQNTYFSPIDKLSYLDHFIFILKLIFFVLFSIPLIFLELISGKLIPFFGKWLPVIFHKLIFPLLYSLMTIYVMPMNIYMVLQYLILLYHH